MHLKLRYGAFELYIIIYMYVFLLDFFETLKYHF
jgi:hypothetical protein